jgi:hypothetical protein
MKFSSKFLTQIRVDRLWARKLWNWRKYNELYLTENSIKLINSFIIFNLMTFIFEFKKLNWFPIFRTWLIITSFPTPISSRCNDVLILYSEPDYFLIVIIVVNSTSLAHLLTTTFILYIYTGIQFNRFIAKYYDFDCTGDLYTCSGESRNRISMNNVRRSIK